MTLASGRSMGILNKCIFQFYQFEISYSENKRSKMLIAAPLDQRINLIIFNQPECFG